MAHTASLRRSLFRFSRRGMALLLVMIGLVVCTVLTTGFLSTQGTSVGIARNERDAAKTHAIAQSGIDMCYWLIRNKPDWRETMPIGNWLTNLPVGDGAVSACVDDDNHYFADDPTQPVVIAATGSYGARTFTLSATVRPTGGGTVFQSGNFVSGSLSLGNNDLVTAAYLDSYDSSLRAYNLLFSGANANFASNTTVNGGLKCYSPSFFRGKYTAGPTANLASVIQLFGTSTGPSQTAHALENRSLGNVVFPNTAGLPSFPAAIVSGSSAQKTVNQSGFYDAFTALNGGAINITVDGTYCVNNDIKLGSANNCSLNIKNGATATVIVKGNINISPNCKISLDPNTALYLYVYGDVNLNNGTINSTGKTSQVVLFGGPNSGTIQITNTFGTFCGALYAPQHDVVMQTNSPEFYGALVAKSLTLKNMAGFHFDEDLRSLDIEQITGGSAPAGAPVYQISINSGPTFPR
jgi:Tfp pilus assembly protein PilX